MQLLLVLSVFSAVRDTLSSSHTTSYSRSCQASGYEVRFDGHSVLSCKIHGEDGAAAMVTAAADQGLDVWSHRIHQARTK